MVFKKSIAIIGEGQTEWYYFNSLRTIMKYPFKLEPGLPRHSDVETMLKLALKYKREDFNYVICLIDMDVIKSNSTERKKYLNSKSKKEYKGIIFIETYPCTEFWFLLHFIPDNPRRLYSNYDDLLKELRKYIPGYEKTKKFLKKDLMEFLNKYGDLNRACKNAKKLCDMSKETPEDAIAYSEIYKLIDLLNEINDMKR